MNHVSLSFQDIYGHSDEGSENGDGKKGSEIPEGGEREWRLPGLLYADDLMLCGKSEEILKEMVGRFFEVYRTKGLNVNAGKSRAMVYLDRVRLEYVSEFKYLGCVFDESDPDGAEFSSKKNACRIGVSTGGLGG